MAALVAGVQYGLSSHSNFHENKSLIFVKLTDSAQRAIEDFLKNRNKTSQNPTIQFSGNEGQLSFPSTQSSHGSAGFTFTLSGNQDMEGPQGSFECVQQTGQKTLENLGALPCKMRIQANDDVYETTRHRMAVAEENSKNKCTRVIKPNGPDIGRKVKVKTTGRPIPPPPPSNSRHHRDTIQSIPNSVSQSSSSSSRLISNNSVSRSHASSSSSNNLNSNSSPSYKSMSNNNNNNNNINNINNNNNVNSNNNNNNNINNQQARYQPEKKLSELVRRPLKERLIHVLALRPYKKPELYDRITREGIKERDRSTMTTILKQIAFMRDNTYHLQRHVWNDVQEDWPFYTEQDKAMLKRRKPQNLTPPGSSDGSSGSGTSPNSTHPGSPPAISAPPPSLMSLKRPGYYQGNDGLQTKRPRISHYRKPAESTSATINSSVNRDNTRTTSADVLIKNDTIYEAKSSSNPSNQRDRNDRTSDCSLNNYNQSIKSSNTPTSDNEDNYIGRYNNCQKINNPSTSRNQSNNLTINKLTTSDNATSDIDYSRIANNYGTSPKNPIGENDFTKKGGGGGRDTRNRDDKEREQRIKLRDNNDKIMKFERDNSATTTNTYNEFPNIGASNFTDNSAATSSLTASPSVTISDSTGEFPDYVTQYPPITTFEERTRYKLDWYADHEVYLKLYDELARIVKYFDQLAQHRNRELESGNYEKVEALREQIVSEYYNVRREHVALKKRYYYLHAKLSRIKEMIDDYDAQFKNKDCANNNNNNNGKKNNGDNLKNDNGLRY